MGIIEEGIMIRIETRMRAMTAPGRYIQGPGEIDNLAKYSARYGDKVLAFIDASLYSMLSDKLTAQYPASKLAMEQFDSTTMETTVAEIDRKTDRYRGHGIDVVIGMGGGKTIDVAKGVGHALKASLIIVPTSASSDAPTSALSVLYHEDGSHSHEVFYHTNPDIVLVDTNIIIQAPVRLFVAGMADALATYIEVRACMQANSPNFVEGGCNRTLTGIAIAKLTYDVILSEGRKAKMAADAKLCTKAFEDVVETNTLMSGLGFENNGSTGAHGFQVGLSTLPQCKGFLHGEFVAFGILCQLMLENAEMQEIEMIATFLIDVGLPVTLAQLGIQENAEEHIREVASVMADGYHMQCEPFLVTKEAVYAAIMTADQMGHYFKSNEQRVV